MENQTAQQFRNVSVGIRQDAARCIFVPKNYLAPLERGTSLGTREVWKLLKMYQMSRKKATNQQELFARSIRTRVTQKDFEKLEKIVASSDCGSIGEVARKILSNDKINCFYRDISLNAPMEEMALIRKELKAIGININQQTHRFHVSGSESQRAFYVLKTAELYKKIGERVELLLGIISQLSEKWLPKS